MMYTNPEKNTYKVILILKFIHLLLKQFLINVQATMLLFCVHAHILEVQYLYVRLMEQCPFAAHTSSIEDLFLISKALPPSLPSQHATLSCVDPTHTHIEVLPCEDTQQLLEIGFSFIRIDYCQYCP